MTARFTSANSPLRSQEQAGWHNGEIYDARPASAHGCDWSTTSAGDASSDASIPVSFVRASRNKLRAVVVIFALYGVVSSSRDLMGAFATSDAAGGPKIAAEDAAKHEQFDGHILTLGDGKAAARATAQTVGAASDGEAVAETFRNIATATTPFDPAHEIPFMWSVGGTGSISLDDILRCFPVTQASWLGSNGSGSNLELIGPVEGNLGTVLDVDMGLHAGIQRAWDVGLVSAGTPLGLIASPFLPETVNLFTSEKKGRIFAVLVDPVVQAKGSWNFLKSKNLYEGSLVDFASGNHVLANNYVTRVLSGQWDGTVDLTDAHLQTAITLLQEKFIVAPNRYQRQLVEEVVRFFGWGESGLACMYPPTSPSQRAEENTTSTVRITVGD